MRQVRSTEQGTVGVELRVLSLCPVLLWKKADLDSALLRCILREVHSGIRESGLDVSQG